MSPANAKESDNDRAGRQAGRGPNASPGVVPVWWPGEVGFIYC